MTPRSLRLRLLGLAALFIALALLVAGIAIGSIFVSNVERGVRADLVANLNRLVAAIDPAGPNLIAESPLPDPRYDTPLSGAYWQIEELGTDTVWRSQSLLDVVLDTSRQATNGGTETFGTVAGPTEDTLAALTGEIHFGDRTLRVTLAESRALLDESIRQFGADLLIALLLLGVALVAAAGLQVGLGLRPLERMRTELGAVRQGRLDVLPADYPSEIQPLANEVNALLATQASTVEFARARAADLAHGLKTPLTVMRTLAPRLAAQGDTEGADLLTGLVDEMNGRVAYQLRLSRLRHRTREHHLSVPLEDAVRTTIEVLKRTPSGETLNWVSSLEQGVEVDVDRQDLGELVGTILENASKWALSEVRVRARRVGSDVELLVSDDGPGLPAEGASELGKRGLRLDESTDGSGLGISIAREIVAINGGSIGFGRADEGGLLVRIVLLAGHKSPAQKPAH